MLVEAAMPYADEERHKKAMRDQYRFRYLTEPGFDAAERERQRKIYEANREKIIARVMKRRAELRAAGK